MFMKITLNASKNKVVDVEVTPSAITYTEGSLVYPYTVTDEEKANKILNNYDALGVTISGSTLLLKLFESASEDPTIRQKTSSEWLTRVRPALMRATQTVGAFNL